MSRGRQRLWTWHGERLSEQVVIRIAESTRERANELAVAEGVAESSVLRNALERGLAALEAEKKDRAA